MHVLLLSDNLKTKARRFSGVANSGKVFVYQGRRAVVDLSTLSIDKTVPALLLHDRAARVGFGDLSIKDGALHIDGKLLDNDHGRALSADADAGFPWQMSAHVLASRVRHLAQGETATINGQTVRYPCTILQHATIAEVSFTPTGVDASTSAVILSMNKEPTTLSEQTTQENAQAAQMTPLQDENAALKAQIKTLQDTVQKLKDEHKAAALSAKLSAKGYIKDGAGFKGLSDTTVQWLLSANADDLDAIINDLPSKTAPGYLLSAQYTKDENAPTSALVADAASRR